MEFDCISLVFRTTGPSAGRNALRFYLKLRCYCLLFSVFALLKRLKLIIIHL